MNLSRTAALVLSIAASAGCATTRPQPPGAPAAGDLAHVVDSIMATAPLDRAHWGVEVFDADAGRMLVRRNADKLFTTASNAKVPTVAAALELLGPEFRWRTVLEARNVVDGVATALVVRGSGDPTFSDHFHPDGLAPLDSLADSLALAGLRRVDGPLIIDESRFDSILVHPAWETFDLDWYYAAPVAPFAILEGAYPVVMRPTTPGQPADVDVLLPDGLVRTDAAVMTVAGQRGWNDDLRRVAGTDSVVLRGEIGAGAGPDTSWIAQDRPGRLAANALARALEARGITIAGPVVATRHPEAVEPGTPSDAPPSSEGEPLRVVWRSPPLAAVARISLEQSDNWVTEQILKTVGAERGDLGSWSEGTRVVEDFLGERVGVPAGAHYLRDGSGLSAQTLMAPSAMVALLRYARERPWHETFRDAMVAPGEIDGTLENRLLQHAGSLVAKTGTITHVNALSGYAETVGGRSLVFSILTASSGQPSSRVRAAMDRIVDAMINGGR